MKAVSVRELKSNPSAALREAREHPVTVLNRHRPVVRTVLCSTYMRPKLHTGDSISIAAPTKRSGFHQR